MGAPIRSAAQISTIINKGQHAIADLGLEIVRDSKRGIDNSDPDFRQKILKLVLLRMFLQNILTTDGVVNAYYSASLNEKKLNNILTGILKLSGFSSGTSIPKITGDNIPVVYYPTGNTFTTINTDAVPGGITFENTNVDAPSEIIDRIDAASSNYAFYIISVYGTGAGEGSRSLTLLVTWRGNNTPVVAEYGSADVGGTTFGVSFSAAYVDGFIELTANVPSDNWIIRGSRISFYNISFQNVPPTLPQGGTTNQLIAKASNNNYDFKFVTLIWSLITDVTATLQEINYVAGVSSSIQDQIDALSTLISGLTTALNDYLLLAGGTMSGDIAMSGNKVTGLAAATGNGEALRYEQLIGLYLLLTGGTMSGNIDMDNNKLTGLPTATDPSDAVPLSQLPSEPTISGTPDVLYKLVTVTAWDMDANASLNTVSHGIADSSKIISVSVKIYPDVGTNQGYDLSCAGLVGWDSSVLLLSRTGGGFFDDIGFNDTLIDRGEALIVYKA